MIKISEFTPEKARELADERDVVKATNLSRLSAERLQQEVHEAEREVHYLHAKRQLRTRELRGSGMLVPEIAEWFRVSVPTVYNWLKAPLEIVLTKSASDLVREHYEVTDSHE